MSPPPPPTADEDILTIPDSEKSKYPIPIPSGLFRGKRATCGPVCGMCGGFIGGEGTNANIDAIGCEKNENCWSHWQCVILVYPTMNIKKDRFICNFHKEGAKESDLPGGDAGATSHDNQVAKAAATSSKVSHLRTSEPLQCDDAIPKRSEWHTYYADADKVNRPVEVPLTHNVAFDDEETEFDADEYNKQEASPPACYDIDLSDDECDEIINKNDDEEISNFIKKNENDKIKNDDLLPCTVMAEIYYGHEYNRRTKPHYLFTNAVAPYAMRTENKQPSPLSVDALHTAYKLNWRNADLKNQKLKRGGFYHHSHQGARSQNEHQLKWDIVLSMALDNMFVLAAVLKNQQRETTPSNDTDQTYTKSKFCLELIVAISTFIDALIKDKNMKVI